MAAGDGDSDSHGGAGILCFLLVSCNQINPAERRTIGASGNSGGKRSSDDSEELHCECRVVDWLWINGEC